ncbi:MAG TPA: ligase-associated DNA damage response exonuclease, partial [Gemmatimonadales bacterium]|nr:ligase-associated DNA damage response exonuclease [Gemmatimonadales bacterium]
MTDLLVPTDRGLYCPAGDFYIDPWRPVPRAVVTHAHGDHLTRGSDAILVSDAGKHVTVARLGSDRGVTTAAWGERRAIRGVTVSLHPAGHVLGAAQVRVEHAGEVWVVSGDYKLAPDPTTAPFEPVRCHTFITESTFGLPIYRWDAPDTIAAAVRAWVTGNRTDGAATILYGYGLGKAQRLMAMLAPLEIPIWTHGAVAALADAYAASGVMLPASAPVSAAPRDTPWHEGVIIAPPSAAGSAWLRRFGPRRREAVASGWMQVRGARRRQAVDRAFVVSDHADWPGLLAAIEATGASRVLVT